jgi:hypothetical protein
MTEEQIKAAQKVLGDMEKKVKPGIPKNVKFRKGKYRGCTVVLVEAKSERTASLNRKESANINKVFHSAQVGRFVVSGTLLRAVNAFPLGSSPCDSLKEFETKTEVIREGDLVFYNKIIRPVKSTLAKEGYPYREELDEIFGSMFKRLA